MSDRATPAKPVTIPREGGQIYGEMYLPKAEGKRPAVIMSHGYNGSYQDYAEEGRTFASHGFVAVAYDFCGGTPRSKSSGKTVDMTIGTERDDLLAVLSYVQSLEYVDRERIFLLGASQGGFVSALAAAARPEEIRGLAMYYPALCIPHDWTKRLPDREAIPEEMEFWGMTLGRGFFLSVHGMDVFQEIARYTGGVLIIHGDRDEVVPLSYSERAKEAYQNAELAVFPGEGHGFSPKKRTEAIRLALKFMQDECEDGAAAGE